MALRDSDWEPAEEVGHAHAARGEAKALRKLRHPSRSKRLKSFVES